MAFVILVTLISVRATTSLPELLDQPAWITALTGFGAVVYSVVLVVTIIHPTRWIHVVGLPLGLLLFGFRAEQFIDLWLGELGRGGIGNVLERAMLTASTVVFHVWGIWADRREIT